MAGNKKKRPVATKKKSSKVKSSSKPARSAKISPSKKSVTVKKTAKKAKKSQPGKTGKPEILEKGFQFPIIGIGASAGGLEALEGLFSHMPQEINAAIVLIQHLSPKHKSIMGSLLQKHTKLKIVPIQDGIKIEPNHVYLNPPNKDVSIINRVLLLTDPIDAHAARLPIDHFFRSLAVDHGEAAICIILSGTGSDGTLGLKAIKGDGGMTMVQDLKQAKYDNMPKSAIDTGMVDFVLPVERMPAELTKYVEHPYIKSPSKFDTAEQKYDNYLNKIFNLIRIKTGHDFSNYKINTTKRRVERRLAVHQIDKISEYYNYLNHNPGEITTLYKDMLIGVTNFFRNPKAFDFLAKKVIPGLLRKKQHNSDIRVWTPGCSTGEEAYSIAMLFIEAMDKIKTRFNIQIFATDIDNESIDYARAGVYPDSISADITAKRIKRFFQKEDGSYKIKKEVREMVVFAEQNLIKDPPFSKLDLASCRNLLIYMDQSLQKKVLAIMHYALNPEGILFLGTSESLGGYSDLFHTLDNKNKIYKRLGSSSDRAEDYLTLPTRNYPPPLPKKLMKDITNDDEVRHVAEKVILDNYSLPCVLLNEHYEIIYGHL